MEGYDELRPPHYLTRNYRTAMPSAVIFWDTETRWVSNPNRPGEEVHRFRLTVARYHRLVAGELTRTQEIRTTDLAEFWQWVLDRLDVKKATWMFAHKAGFDLTVSRFWELVEMDVFRLADDLWPMRRMIHSSGRGQKPWRGILVAEDPPTIVGCRSENRTLNIVDTLNYWRCSVAELGKDFGLAKVPLPAVDAPDEEWFARCAADVAVIEAAVTNLINLWRFHDLGQWRSTAAGLAWNAFRHRFMNQKILIHGHKKAIDLERAAYYGGEVRSFFVGTIHHPVNVARTIVPRRGEHGPGQELGPVFDLDVTSMYPSVMRSNLFPVRLTWWADKSTITTLEGIKPGQGAIAEVELRTDQTYPVRAEKRPTRYAVGHYTTVLAWPELQRALRSDHIVSVGRCAIYDLAELFTDYVDFFRNLRTLAAGCHKPAEERFMKLMLTSLSGKWGQKANKWDEAPDEPAICPWQQWWRGEDEHGMPQLWRSIAHHTQRSGAPGESPDSFPAIVAWITSLGRELMLHLRQVAGQVNVYYQDTDSLHVNAAGYLALEHAGYVGENDLGLLRLKQSAWTGAYYGLKHYRLGTKVVVGAVSRESITDDGTTYEYLKLQRLPSILRSRPDGTIVAQTVSRTLSLNHPDGTAAADGWVRPLTL